MRPFLLYLNALQSIGVTAFVNGTLVEECKTQLGVSSVHNVPSSTRTVTLSLTAYKKICPTQVKTVTPSPTTVTITSTATSTNVVTAQQSTGTVTTTQTSTVTSTQTNTDTTTSTTVTSTTFVSTPTSTVPTPAGFTPIASEAGYVAKHKRNVSTKNCGRNDKLPLKKSCDGKSAVHSPALYPVAVSCIDVVEAITTQTVTIPRCSTTQTTTIPASTTTSTSTVTTTVTSTSTPAAATITVTASTTVTTTSTTATTTTTTVTSTDTISSTAPTATFYAACASNNLVGSANGGHGIGQVTYNSGGTSNTISRSSAASTYDCCVACQRATNCIYSDFLFGSCELIIGSSCNIGSSSGTSFQTSSNLGAGSGFVVSNGPCGYVPNGGNI